MVHGQLVSLDPQVQLARQVLPALLAPLALLVQHRQHPVRLVQQEAPAQQVAPVQLVLQGQLDLKVSKAFKEIQDLLDPQVLPDRPVQQLL